MTQRTVNFFYERTQKMYAMCSAVFIINTVQLFEEPENNGHELPEHVYFAQCICLVFISFQL
jgi:hypothetical protein